jgi:hypothetical protein
MIKVFIRAYFMQVKEPTYPNGFHLSKAGQNQNSPIGDIQ